MENYDKNYGRYTLIGADPEEVITSSGNALVIQKRDGTKEVRRGNPVFTGKSREKIEDFCRECRNGGEDE